MTVAKKGRDDSISNSQLIAELFHHDVSTVTDDPDIHPPNFCNSCYLIMRKMRNAAKEGGVYRTSGLKLHTCMSKHHNEYEYNTCAMISKMKVGGRPKHKLANITGCSHFYYRPHTLSCWSTLQMPSPPQPVGSWQPLQA